MTPQTSTRIVDAWRPGRRRARGRQASVLTALGLATMLGVSACGQGESPPPAASSGPPTSTPVAAAPPGAVPSGDADKGRQVYLGYCVTCHNRDPAKDGPLGPAVKGSSAELVEARVLRAAYPPGYVPKRPSKVMPPRPDLSASVGDLAAYLR